MNLRVDGKAAFAYTAAHALDAAKPTVVFVHGAGLDHSSFGLQSRYFGYHGWNVLALDLPGHGRSEGPPIPSVEGMARWVLAAADSVSVKSFSVVGHSMGALVALECAAQAPQRVERVALIAIAFPMRVSDEFLAAAKADDYAAFDMHTIWGHAPKTPLGRDASPGMWTYGDTQARLERLKPGTLHNDLKACNDYAGGEASAAKVKCPALLVLGRRDTMTPPKAGLEFQKKFADARSVLVEPSGHSLMVEAPDATLDALIEFLR